MDNRYNVASEHPGTGMTDSDDPPIPPDLGAGRSRESAVALQEYTPTRKAESLFPAFGHLHHWAIEYDL